MNRNLYYLGVFIYLSLSFVWVSPLLGGIQEDIKNMKPGEWYEIPNSKLIDSGQTPEPQPYGNSGLKSIVSAWSGGVYDTQKNRLLIWGGGHNDYAGNELYAFDMKIFKWSRIWGPTPNHLIQTDSEPAQAYEDGNPASRHTYNALQYIPGLNMLWNHGGSIWRSLGGRRSRTIPTWMFHLDKLEWEMVGQLEEGGGTSAYDPVTGHVFSRARHGLYEFNPVSRKWRKRYRYGGGWWPHPTAAIDPQRRIMVFVGAQKLDIFNINTTEYISHTQQKVKGSVEILSGPAPGMVFDSSIKKFVAWDGNNQKEISSQDVYVVDIETLRIEKRRPAHTNRVIPTNGSKRGTYGRFQYISEMDRYILVNSIHDNVFIYRLSNLTGDTKGSGSTHHMDELRVLPTRFGVGIEWDIGANEHQDQNHNATVRVLFRKSGKKAWKHALPLMRVDAFHLNMMAGSILFLEPDTEYEISLKYTDPDGGNWSAVRQFKTLPIPRQPDSGRVFHIVPGIGGGTGTPEDPFHGIEAAKKIARPGDTFVLGNGLYGETVNFNVKGAPGRYIVWKGSEKSVFLKKIIVGAGYNWFESIQFKIDSDCVGIASSGNSFSNSPHHIVIKKNRFSGGKSCGTKFYYIRGTPHGRNWYITDNIITGPYDLDIKTFGGEGIDMGHHTPYPTGHTIAHNRISRVGDAISYPGGNCDIFGNDLFEILDDAIEPDYAPANVRIYRNRISMAKHNAISLQDFDNGPPWYIVGNQIISYGQSVLKTRQRETQFHFYHNTVVNWKSMFLHQADLALFGHSKNNLMITMTDGKMWDFGRAQPDWRTAIDFNAFDWGRSTVPFRFGGNNYSNLTDYSKASGLDMNSLVIDWRKCFKNIEYIGPTPESIPLQYLELRSDSPVIDKGVILPGINDGFSGTAPDIGAYEYGKPLPHYGPFLN